MRFVNRSLVGASIVLLGCTSGNMAVPDGGSSNDNDGGLVSNDGGISTGSRVNTSLGTNLNNINDWSSEWSFVDAMKQSRPWISGTRSTWDDGHAIDVDANGWVRSLAPGQIVRALFFWGPDVHNPGGRYVVLYDGKGTLEYPMGATRDAAASTPGRDVLSVNAGQQFEIDITAIDASDPLRNIRVIMPGGVCSDDKFRWCDEQNACASGTCESFEKNYATQIFHPRLLASIKNYRALRFMDWNDTNGEASPVVGSWAQRPKPTDARWTIKGVPVEIQVALANRMGADAWLNIVHLADDDYVTHFAETVRDQLRPDLKAYVEYSNEVWNGIFPQAQYAQQQGVALALSSDPTQAQYRFYSRRAVEIFKIWEKVFGGTSRFVRVMASWAAAPAASTDELDWGDAAQHTDALAIAPYFEADPMQVNRSTTLDQLFAHLQTTSLPMVSQMIAQHAAIARAHHIPLIAYEGGQSLVAGQPDAALDALYDAANRDPRMGQLYATYLAEWKQNGGALFMHYLNCASYNQFGRWGSLEYLDQPRAQAPKYDALQTFIETVQPWW